MKDKKPLFDSTSIYVLLACLICIFMGYGLVKIAKNDDRIITNQNTIHQNQIEIKENQIEIKENQKHVIEDQHHIHDLIDSARKHY